MIAVDTNLLVRHLTQDDPAQAAKVLLLLPLEQKPVLAPKEPTLLLLALTRLLPVKVLVLLLLDTAQVITHS